MKTKLFIAAMLAAAGLAGAQMFAQLFGTTGTPIPAVAWYRFDGNALDSSGNGYDGTVVNSTPTNDGKYGGAYQFATYGNYISSSANPNSSNVSACAWVNVSTNTQTGGVICFPPFPNFLAYVPARTLRLVDPPFSSTFTAANSIPIGSWTHVAYSYSGKDKHAKIYINGVLSATAPATGGAINNTLRIGKTSVDAQTFYGKIDDVRIYGRALSLANIQRIMTGQDVAPIEELQ